MGNACNNNRSPSLKHLSNKLSCLPSNPQPPKNLHFRKIPSKIKSQINLRIESAITKGRDLKQLQKLRLKQLSSLKLNIIFYNEIKNSKVQRRLWSTVKNIKLKNLTLSLQKCSNRELNHLYPIMKSWNALSTFKVKFDDLNYICDNCLVTLFPCCCNKCKDTVHVCPGCQREVGRERYLV